MAADLKLKIFFRLAATIISIDFLLKLVSEAPSLTVFNEVYNAVLNNDVGLLFNVVIKTIPLVSLTLVLLALAFLNPLLHAFSVVLTVASDLDLSLITIAPLPIISIFSSLETSWRPGFYKSLKIHKQVSFIVSFVMLVLVFICLSILLGTFLWRATLVLERATESIAEPSLTPLIEFASINPLFRLITISVFLVLTYIATFRVIEVLALFIKPSRMLSLLFLEKSGEEVQLRPPLASLRSAMAALLLTPPFYLLFNKLLFEKVQTLELSPFSQFLVSMVIAYATFSLFWLLTSQILKMSWNEEPSLFMVLAGLALILSFYVVAYFIGYWDPSSGFLELSRLNDVLRKVIDDYSFFFRLIEGILKVIGAVP
ncbi:MAG: hypothetical protein QW065_01365 [Acidilobaceae archaeon]